MPGEQKNKHLSVYGQMTCAALAGCTADIFTFPLDTVKVWLQVQKTGSKKVSSSGNMNKLYRSFSTLRQNKSVMSKPENATVRGARQSSKLFAFKSNHKTTKRVSRPTVFRTIANGVKSNGFSSLYGGLSAGLQRQIAFCGVRFGIYDSVKDFYSDLFGANKEGKQIGIRLLAGTTTPLIAVSLFQPTEVVKIRMQAQARSCKTKRMYPSTFSAYNHIFRGGLAAAWQGFSANAARLTVVNVSELVTYDVAKESILEYGLMKDNIFCHFSSAFIAGFVTTLVASPVDVVKTRYMNSQRGTYAGVFDCAKRLLMKNGPMAFYRGFVPAYLRLGSWNIVMFVSYEQYKRLWCKYTDE